MAPAIGKDPRRIDNRRRRANGISHVHPPDQRAGGRSWVCFFVDRTVDFYLDGNRCCKKERLRAARNLGDALLHPAVLPVVAASDQRSRLGHPDSVAVDVPNERMVELDSSAGDFRIGAWFWKSYPKWTGRGIEPRSPACKTSVFPLDQPPRATNSKALKFSNCRLRNRTEPSGLMRAGWTPVRLHKFV